MEISQELLERIIKVLQNNMFIDDDTNNDEVVELLEELEELETLK